jgi:hypothetical protein
VPQQAVRRNNAGGSEVFLVRDDNRASLVRCEKEAAKNVRSVRCVALSSTLCRSMLRRLVESRSLIAAPMSRVPLISPARVTVLSAVGIIRRNIWSEAQVLQCPQRAGIQ